MNREHRMNRFAWSPQRLRRARQAAALAALAVLTACSSSGPATTANPVTAPPTVQAYSGPAPENADVQAFKINLWQNIEGADKCGGCHHAGGQSPQFARADDINLAYQAANTVVNLTQPDQSEMVKKVAGGHNCWLASPAACGDTLTVWIQNWAGANAVGGTQIQLVAPPSQTVGPSKTFPASSASFASTIWQPLLVPYCSRCHSDNAQTPQAPYFASANPDEAYADAQSKINLDDPAQSRFVIRLATEFHHCWTTSCAADAAAMQAAITAFANGIPTTQVDPSLVVSKQLSLLQGTVASGQNRYDSALIALYQFKTGSGSVAYDTSGVLPGLDLTLTGNVSWVGGWGINIAPGGKAQGSTEASQKLATLIQSTGEFSLEAWIANGNVTQKDADIISYSGGDTTRNVTLSQQLQQYEAQVRSSKTGENGDPAMLTALANNSAQASLQHVVLTFDPVAGRKLYVNGIFTGDVDAQGGGTLAAWDNTFALVIGAETSSDHPWAGVVRLLAIHDRALTAAQVQQNFTAGVGEKYYLLFDVSTLVNIPKSYIMLTGSELDSYSYLFARPTFINLDPTQKPTNIPIAGIRIGLNGAEVGVGQAYIPLNTTVTAANYSPTAGEILSTVGTAIAVQKGPASDQIFLTFEKIASKTHTVVAPPPPVPPAPVDTAVNPDLGARTFDKLLYTMSDITGVPVTDSGVASTFAGLQQSLPSTESIDAFSASNQQALAQLAIEFCHQLVNNPTLSAKFFPGLDYSQPAGSYFASQSNVNLVINPLIAKAQIVDGHGVQVASQPSVAAVTTELNNLIAQLSTGQNGAGRTAAVTTAACAAVLGSAAIVLH
jgi:Concanavalin A-like lectin/glucanases superfamily